MRKYRTIQATWGTETTLSAEVELICLERVADELGRLVERLDALVSASPAGPVHQNLFRTHGKLLRPRILFTCALHGEQTGGDPDWPAARKAALAIELAHIGSLYHDDIVDRCFERRGGPSVHSEFGVRVAALAGAHILALSNSLRRAAVCLELVRLAAVLLDDLDVDVKPSIDGSRGGGWLASSLAIGLGDQLLARCFAISAKLPKPDRDVVTSTIVRIVERLTSRALISNASVGHETSRIIAAEAARAGALIGGASETCAERLAVQAEDVSSQVPPEEFASTDLGRVATSAPAVEAQAG